MAIRNLLMSEEETETLRQTTMRWRTQVRQLMKLTEAQAALGWGIILLLAAVLGTIYLAQASNIAETGRRVQILQIQLEELKRQNSDIEREIAEAQSLERLQQQALRLGFVLADPADIEYIIVPDYPTEVELSQERTETIPTPQAKPIESMEEAVWIAITKNFSGLTRGESVEQ